MRLQHRAWWIPGLATLPLLGLGLVATVPGARGFGQDAPAARGAEESAVRALSEGFVAAYNKRDARAIAALFTEDARVVEKDGEIIEGREAILQRFLDSLEDPDAPTLRLEIASLRFPAPGVAVEDGVLIAQGEGSRRSPFTALHVRKGEKWQTAEVRDRAEPPGAPDEGHAALAELDWMIGEWVDESEHGVVQTTCKRSEDGHFLLREFSMKARGAIITQGSQRVGWDPVRKQLRSWVFDSEGGFNEGFWTRTGPDRWVIRTNGYLRDGDIVAATNLVTRVSRDSFRWGSADRVVGDASFDDVEEILVVRKPPGPK